MESCQIKGQLAYLFITTRFTPINIYPFIAPFKRAPRVLARRPTWHLNAFTPHGKAGALKRLILKKHLMIYRVRMQRCSFHLVFRAVNFAAHCLSNTSMIKMLRDCCGEFAAVRLLWLLICRCGRQLWNAWHAGHFLQRRPRHRRFGIVTH